MASSSPRSWSGPSKATESTKSGQSDDDGGHLDVSAVPVDGPSPSKATTVSTKSGQSDPDGFPLAKVYGAKAGGSWHSLGLGAWSAAEGAIGDEALEDLSSFLGLIKRIADSSTFEHVMGAIICVDILVSALEVDLRDTSRVFFDVVEVLLVAAYFFEFFLRVAMGCGAAAEPHRAERVRWDMLLVVDGFVLAARILDLSLWFSSHSISEDVQNGVTVVATTFRMLRLIRIASLSVILLLQVPALHFFADALRRSFEVMLNVLLVGSGMVFMFSLMLTTLVPASSQEPDAVKQMLIEDFGSISKSAWSLFCMFGGREWGVSTALALYLKSEGFVVIIFLVVLLVACVSLTVALSGLVCGMFLYSLATATRRREVEAKEQEAKLSLALTQKLEDCFLQQGFEPHELLAWEEVEKVLEALSAGHNSVWEEIGLDISDVRNVFQQVDMLDEGSIRTTELTKGIFDLLTLPRFDMVSLDYQQEKVLTVMSELRNRLRRSAAELQSSLVKLVTVLKTLDREAATIKMNMAEVQRLERDLHQRREERRARPRKVVPKLHQNLSAEELWQNSQLNQRLCKLEESVACLNPGAADGIEVNDRGPQPTEVTERVAADIVRSMQLVLRAELDQLAAGRQVEPSPT